MEIERQNFGSSRLMVSKLGLGLASLGRPGYINEGHQLDLAGRADRHAMQRNAAAVLQTAFDAGVNYFDAARSYGEAENFLRTWLSSRSIAETDVVIGSKWGYTYVADWQVDIDVHEVKDHSPAAFDRQRCETEQALGSYLDLYQIHSVTPDSPVLGDVAVLRRLAELKQQGTLIGLSTSGPQQADVVRKAIDVTVDSQQLFDVVQATWNVLEPSVGNALTEASGAGISVIIKEALGNGRLTERGDYAQQLAGGSFAADAHALAAALAQPFATIVLSGATTVEQLKSNLNATKAEPATDIAAIDPAEYWAQRSQRSWT